MIRRQRLLDLLAASDPGSIALLQAPAGYGKTTLLVDTCQDSTERVSWVSLDEWDQDINIFLQYLRQSIGLTGGRRLTGAFDMQVAVGEIVAHLAGQDTESSVVLDDLQTVDSKVPTRSTRSPAPNTFRSICPLRSLVAYPTSLVTF